METEKSRDREEDRGESDEAQGWSKNQKTEEEEEGERRGGGALNSGDVALGMLMRQGPFSVRLL